MAGQYQRELEVAIAAVAEAAKVCRDVAASMDPAAIAKKDKSPVTVADFASQAVVCRHLHDEFAGDPVIAEEDSSELQATDNAVLCDRVVDHVRKVGHAYRGATAEHVCGWIDHGRTGHRDAGVAGRDVASGGRFWTLDPIDGTKGFLRQEQYAIALALIVEGKVAVAVLGCPNYEGGRLYAAVRGQGAFVTGIDGAGERRPVRVTSTADTAAMRMCESVESGHSSHDDASRIAASLGVTAESVRMDSQCKYAAVAGGDADAYLRLPTRADYVERIWDHAAGVGVITEAGGRVTDVTGAELDFTCGAGLERNKGVVATNGRLHDAVVRAVRKQLGIG